MNDSHLGGHRLLGPTWAPTSNPLARLAEVYRRLYGHREMSRGDPVDETGGYWSKWAPLWDFALRAVGLHTKYRKEATGVLGLEKGETVLDAACGTGLNLPYLHDGVGAEGLIVAVDIAPGMLRRAEKRAHRHGFENVEFVLADIASAGFPKVDAVSAFWCMISFPNYRDALARLVDSLRPAGRIALLDFKRIEGAGASLLNPIFENVCRLTKQDVTREPWLDLQRLLGRMEMHEWKYGGLMSSVYLAWGSKQ